MSYGLRPRFSHRDIRVIAKTAGIATGMTALSGQRCGSGRKRADSDPDSSGTVPAIGVVMNTTTLVATTAAGSVSILCHDEAHAAKLADAIEKFCFEDGSYLLESDVVILSGTFGTLCADVVGFEIRKNGAWAGGLVAIAL